MRRRIATASLALLTTLFFTIPVAAAPALDTGSWLTPVLDWAQTWFDDTNHDPPPPPPPEDS